MRCEGSGDQNRLGVDGVQGGVEIGEALGIGQFELLLRLGEGRGVGVDHGDPLDRRHRRQYLGAPVPSPSAKSHLDQP